LTFTPAKIYQSLVFSSADLETGGEYSIFTGGNTSGESLAGLTTSGSYNPGTELTSFTVTSAITWIGNAVGMGGGRRR
jgi:hypothetical protein